MQEYEPIRKLISKENKINCWEYLKTHSLANRGVYDGDKEKQLTGLIAETETHKLLLDEYPNLNEKEDGFDGGVDINYLGYTIDVKSMGRSFYTKPEYVNNFPKLQSHYACDIIIFTSLNKKTNIIEFCGWIWKNEIDNKADFFKKGEVRNRGLNDTMVTSTDNYEIKNSNLRDIREILV